ncbi:MAG: homoserine O-succinyltransferase [Ruthenibacterium sp.]
MPLILPQELPAYRALEQENVFVMQRRRAQMQDIRPLQILILNLMPTKIATETQLARVLANSPLQVELTLLHMDSHVSTHVSGMHLEAFYKTFEDVKNRRFDGMIITGAPVEMMPFEQVDYWNELCRIFDYSKTHVYSTLHICWGAQAALYYHYGIQKELLPAKISGVYAHRVLRPKTPLVRGFDELFYAPHSRYTAVNRADVAREKALRVLADSDEAGLHLLETDSGRQIFVCGHMEYDKYTLRDEYRRDVAKGLVIAPPAHYFIDDDPAKDVLFRWRSHANLLFSNWLNYYVYQATPFNLENLT